MVVNVTGIGQPDGQFACYNMLDGEAWIVFRGSLDDCRSWAIDAGYDGILIGSPSCPFGNL
jgi:hypothetical protein